MSDDIELMDLALHAIPADPSVIGWPPTLPIELALQASPLDAILEAYGLTYEDYRVLLETPGFVKQVAGAIEALKEDGMSFVMKARLQSEELLARSWAMTHAPYDEVPPAVQADLIKATWRVAGLDASKNQQQVATGPSLAIQINFNKE